MNLGFSLRICVFEIYHVRLYIVEKWEFGLASATRGVGHFGKYALAKWTAVEETQGVAPNFMV